VDRLRGIVSAVIGSRGFGFIVANSQKYFFHFSQFQVGKVPVVGLDVTFQMLPQQDGKSPVAVDVRVADGGVA
jgi:cold shock CspA family protein